MPTNVLIEAVPEASFADVAYIEAWAFSSPPADVRLKHDASTGELKGTIAVVAMTRIALGDPDFEKAFPEYAHANPKNLD
nr:hypothetical protein [Pseudomonas fluorescens]